MAEDVMLYVLAEFDPRTEERLSNYRDLMIAAGYVGTQTVGINNHVTLCSFPVEREAALRAQIEAMNGAPAAPVEFAGTGTFDDRVLFLAPEKTPALLKLHAEFDEGRDWVPHCTMFLSEEGGVRDAKVHLDEIFQPFSGCIVRLGLYEFFPSRFLQSAELAISSDSGL